jgi:hypothetical protein
MFASRLHCPAGRVPATYHGVFGSKPFGTSLGPLVISMARNLGAPFRIKLRTHTLLKLLYNFGMRRSDGWAASALNSLRRVAVLLGPFFGSTRAASILPSRPPTLAAAAHRSCQGWPRLRGHPKQGNRVKQFKLQLGPVDIRRYEGDSPESGKLNQG